MECITDINELIGGTTTNRPSNPPSTEHLRRTGHSLVTRKAAKIVALANHYWTQLINSSYMDCVVAGLFRSVPVEPPGVTCVM